MADGIWGAKPLEPGVGPAVCESQVEADAATCPAEPTDALLTEYENWDRYEAVRKKTCEGPRRRKDLGLSCEFLDWGNESALKLMGELAEEKTSWRAEDVLGQLWWYDRNVELVELVSKAAPRGTDFLELNRCTGGYAFEFPDLPECTQYAPVVPKTEAPLLVREDDASPKPAPTWGGGDAVSAESSYKLSYTLYLQPPVPVVVTKPSNEI